MRRNIAAVAVSALVASYGLSCPILASESSSDLQAVYRLPALKELAQKLISGSSRGTQVSLSQRLLSEEGLPEMVKVHFQVTRTDDPSLSFQWTARCQREPFNRDHCSAENGERKAREIWLKLFVEDDGGALGLGTAHGIGGAGMKFREKYRYKGTFFDQRAVIPLRDWQSGFTVDLVRVLGFGRDARAEPVGSVLIKLAK